MRKMVKTKKVKVLALARMNKKVINCRRVKTIMKLLCKMMSNRKKMKLKMRKIRMKNLNLKLVYKMSKMKLFRIKSRKTKIIMMNSKART